MSDFAQSVLINGLLNNSIDRLSLQNNVVPGARHNQHKHHLVHHRPVAQVQALAVVHVTTVFLHK